MPEDEGYPLAKPDFKIKLAAQRKIYKLQTKAIGTANSRLFSPKTSETHKSQEKQTIALRSLAN
ncbi:hypothetical protein JYG33_08475 [Alcaligenes sp. SORT26]|uniref:hypothetical protein n=1 Tax=Alcaligenes sp. SORT26 TaxID=2813780 RepID=UPI001A9DC6E2|nr:hypothetical protein [Alcaligenes sp. SORT26]QTC01451.1 hypothetical protein JYG33_08475 [Alcaligenes sp. SORT26]